jgi:hypothetical protein
MPRYEKAAAQVIEGRIGNAVSGDGRLTFIPIISYRYQVNGQEIVNNKYTQNPVGTRNQRTIHKIIDKYPAGSTIEIFYNVDAPTGSFIQKGFGRSVNLFLWIMVIVSLLALGAAVLIANEQGIIHLF